MKDLSQPVLAACGAVASAAAAELDSQVKLSDNRAQLLLLGWRSFICSVAVVSGVINLVLPFRLMLWKYLTMYLCLFIPSKSCSLEYCT